MGTSNGDRSKGIMFSLWIIFSPATMYNRTIRALNPISFVIVASHLEFSTLGVSSDCEVDFTPPT